MSDAPPEFPGIERVLIDRAAIDRRVREMGRRIAEDMQRELQAGEAPGARQLVLIPILTGSIVFVADLIRQVPMMMSLRVVAVSSYPGASMVSKGAKIRGELPGDLAGRHVLIVDDVLDTGRTLGLVRSMIGEQRPASLRVCVLLRKRGAREDGAGWEPDYVGFDIPDEFVVGYGLDCDGYYRNYPEIATLRPRGADGGGR